MSQVELDKVDPRFSIVKRIAHALGVSIDTFAKEDAETTAPQPKRQRTQKAAPVAACAETAMAPENATP